MPTLNIQGHKVTVDDTFLQLPADEQNRAVDEIASHLGVSPAASRAPGPTLDQLGTALVNADKAGDTDAARALATEIKRVRSSPPSGNVGASPGANMPIHVQAPNGEIVEFPSGTSDAVMEKAMRQTYGFQGQQHPSPSGGAQTPYERATAGMGYGAASSQPSKVIDAAQNDRLMQQQDMAGPGGAALAASSGFINGIPIVGPSIQGGIQNAAYAARALVDGRPYADVQQQGQAATDAAQAAHPYVTTGAQISGAVAPMIPLGATQLGARALGIEGPSLLGRAGMSMGSSAAIGAADTAARGENLGRVGASALISGGIGGAVPLVGAAARAGIGAIAGRVAPQVSALLNPDLEAARRVGTAMSRDVAADPASVMSATDELGARAAGVPIINADRGGETTRALVRSVANQSPEARGQIVKAADDRFATQSQRAVDFVKKIAGGNVDDLAYQDTIQAAAKATNDPAYKAAFAHPNAQSLYTPGLQELMQSPSMRAAVEQVPNRSADRGAVQGFKEIGNPFSMDSHGNYVLKPRADGTRVTPNLQFWNQAKINLDSQISAAQRAGDKALTGDLMGLKNKLVGELDAAVPQYQTARQGAAGFFGAENALDAGKNFANQPRTIPEATRAYAQFTDAQKKAFMAGHASELIDRLKASPDRSNVINSVFKNQASREQLNLVYGAQKARQLEAYVRVEDLADRLRGALGNSTTARQLVELGIGAGVGGGAGYGLTGDWKGAALGAVAPKTLQYLGSKADTQVYQSMAKLLTQNNPGALQAAVAIAAQKPAYMTALEGMGEALAVPARTAPTAIAGQQVQ
ncbi:hypothetical protein [Rhizobium sp. HT1-10]|uniref:hypothetical protein n=1 Tax=Rhizobium sp. HT1-10 TaxID=3111638 RepID=UPI003C27771C